MNIAAAERHLREAQIHMARGNARRCRAALDQGLQLAAGSGTSVEAGLLVRSAQLTAYDFDSAVALDAARTAMSAASRIGAFVADAELAVGTAMYVTGSEDCIRRFAAVRRAATAGGTLDLAFEAWLWQSGASQAFGDPRKAIALAESLAEAACVQRKHLWANRARWAAARCRWLAFGEARHAVDVLSSLRPSRALGLERPQILADLALALSDTGETDEAYRMLDRSAREADTGLTRGVAAYYLAEVEWAAGRPSRALSAAEAALGQNLPEPIQIVLRSLRLWALFDLGRPASDPKLRRTIYPLTAGVLDEGRAFALLAEGRLKEAEDAMIAAAGSWHENVVRCELRSRWAAGELARRRGDAERARALLCEVEQEAMAVDCVPVLGRVRASLRCLVKSSGPRSTARPQLSRRETEVLQLVATGQTSIVIATSLGISARTADAHTAAAMAKLGAKTRVQAAALAKAGAASSAWSPGLVPEQLALLKALADGVTVSHAAGQFGISRRTATRRLASARQALAVATNTEAAELVARGAD